MSHLEAQPSGSRIAVCLSALLISGGPKALSRIQCRFGRRKFGGEVAATAKGIVRRRNTVQMVCIADPASRVGSSVCSRRGLLQPGGSSCRGLAVISIPYGPPGRNRLPRHVVAESVTYRLQGITKYLSRDGRQIIGTSAKIEGAVRDARRRLRTVAEPASMMLQSSRPGCASAKP
jgi:hypothetical protein